LRCVSDADLRSTIQGATNKSEALNRFLKWTFFGGEGIIMENSRDEQRKAIKYNHLVANCQIFHNLLIGFFGSILEERLNENGRRADRVLKKGSRKGATSCLLSAPSGLIPARSIG
jgi:hypothetical protein